MENRNSEAIDSFTSGIEMKPSFMLFIERGKTYLKIKRFDQAIDDFDSAIKMKPEHGKAYFHKGIAFFKKGNKKKGVRLIKKSAGLRNHAARLWLKSKNIQWRWIVLFPRYNQSHWTDTPGRHVDDLFSLEA
jgi:tetratricopeptide (TPR) repeat protein